MRRGRVPAGRAGHAGHAERTVKRFCVSGRAARAHMFSVDFTPPGLQHAMRELAIQLGFSRRCVTAAAVVSLHPNRK